MNTLKIIRDELAENPREAWDNLGTFYMRHKRYAFGDKNATEPDEDFDGIRLPVYMYDHSGLTINTTGFNCPWDSGQIGWIYISRQKIFKEYGWKVLTKKRRETIENYLKNEIEVVNAWLQGDVYGYIVLDGSGEEIASCWGFYGRDYKTNGIADYVNLSQITNIERC